MRFACLLCAALLLRCGPPQPDAGAPARATAAVLSETPAGTPLDTMLARMDRHLVNALRGQMEGDAVAEFRRAEALSDRLLEARLPFEWISAEHYSLEARLRQIQSTADRVHAQLETLSPREQMLLDLRSLRTDVVRLRQAIAQGGERAPPSIADLLRADSSRPPPVEVIAPARPESRAGPAPLGVPIPITTGG